MDGSVNFKMPNVEITAKSMHFNLENGYGTLTEAKGSFGNTLIFTAGKIQRTGPDSFKIWDGTVTSCPADNQEWVFSAKSLGVQMEGLAIFKDVKLKFYDTSVFYAPYWFAPAVTKRSSGFLLPGIGSSSTSGVFMNNSYFWAISEQTDATFYFDVMTQRGTREGLEYRYALAERTRGQMNADYIADSSLGDNLWSFKYNHAQEISDNVDAMANVDLESRISYSKQFSPDNFIRSRPYTDSSLNLSSDIGVWFLSLSGREQSGIEQTSQEVFGKRPELKIAALPHSLFKTPLQIGGEAVATSFYYTSLPGSQTLSRLDLHPTISLPFSMSRLFNVTPYVTGHATYYGDNISQTGPITTNYYTAGVGVEGPRMFRIFEAPGDGYKHTITPRLDYSFVPGYEVDGTNRQNAFKLDAIDYSTPQSLLSFTLMNRVFSKKRGGEIFWLSLQQGYDVNEAIRTDIPSPTPFSPLKLELKTKPGDYLVFNMDMSYNHYQSQPDTMSQELGFSTPESAFYLSYDRSYSRQQQSISPNGVITYLPQPTIFSSGLLGYKISAKYSTEVSGIYDEYLQQYDGTLFLLKYTSCCWGASLTAGTRPRVTTLPNGAIRQESETKINFSINLKGIGDIGEKPTPLVARKL
jgi:LPS-assembly protein